MDNLEKFKNFVTHLEKMKEQNKIRLLFRGVQGTFAFDRLGLIWKLNDFEQFAERLFFFGEKSKTFWEKPCTEKVDILGNRYESNDISLNMFEYIFQSFNYVISIPNPKKATKEFILKNKKTFETFTIKENFYSFYSQIEMLSDKEKTEIRNHYLVVLHQLGDTEYNNISNFISSSEKYNLANFFSKNEIVVKFWDTNMNINTTHVPSNTDMPCFIDSPYKKQKEISLFSVIFPHYIYAFSYKDRTYFNPYIIQSQNFEQSILNGLSIDQKNFEQRLKTDTAYAHGISRISFEGEYSYKEI